jgi:hypothetical protein
LTKLATAGQKRVGEFLDKAEAAGTQALGRVTYAQNAMIGAMGIATHDQLEDLTRKVRRLMKKAARVSRHDNASQQRQG